MQDDTKFTKGEWVAYVGEVYLNQGYASVESEDKRIHGSKMYSSTEIEETANAYLIAAAPNLYQSAIDAMVLLERMGLESSDEYRSLKASTEKARGTK